FDVEHETLRRTCLVRDDDDIVGSLQIALPHPLFVDQIVRQLEMIECVSYPAHVLRAAPGTENGNTWQVEIVHRYGWRVCQADSGQTERLDRRLHSRAVAGNHERSRRKGRLALSELLLNRLNPQILQPIAKRDHAVRSCVGDDELRAGAGDGSG